MHAWNIAHCLSIHSARAHFGTCFSAHISHESFVTQSLDDLHGALDTREHGSITSQHPPTHTDVVQDGHLFSLHMAHIVPDTLQSLSS